MTHSNTFGLKERESIPFQVKGSVLFDLNCFIYENFWKIEIQKEAFKKLLWLNGGCYLPLHSSVAGTENESVKKKNLLLS